jgi:hypothetical protein
VLNFFTQNEGLAPDQLVLAARRRKLQRAA